MHWNLLKIASIEDGMDLSNRMGLFVVSVQPGLIVLIDGNPREKLSQKLSDQL
jgi:hypothetical protein